MPRLKLQISETIAEIFRLSEDCTLGRTKASDIVLLDSSISRKHCRIFKQANEYQIVDLGSGNGTSVNGEPVKGTRILQTDDLIQLGSKELVYDGFDIEQIPPAHVVDLTKKPLASFSDEILVESEDVLFIIPTLEPLMEIIYEIATRNIYLSHLTEAQQDVFIPAVVEAMRNAAEHGNQFNISKLLKFRCVKDQRRVVIQISDQGAGFDWKEKLKIGFEIAKDSKRNELFMNGEVEPEDPYMGKIGMGLLYIINNVPSVEFNQEGNAISLIHLIG